MAGAITWNWFLYLFLCGSFVESSTSSCSESSSSKEGGKREEKEREEEVITSSTKDKPRQKTFAK